MVLFFSADLLAAEFDAEDNVGHSNRLFDRFSIPFSEADLVRYRYS